MHIKPDKVTSTPKRKADEGEGSTEPKLSRMEEEIVMEVEQIEPLSISLDIVPNYSNNPELEGEMEEYYSTKEYAVTSQGREFYAKSANGDEIYPLEDFRYATHVLDVDGREHHVEYLPLNKDGSKNFLRDPQNNMMYPFDLTSDQPIFEVDENGKELYLKEGLDEICPLNKQGKPVYAKTAQKHEYIPTIQGVLTYVKDMEGKEHYPKTNEGHEYYVWEGLVQKGARKANGLHYYAKDNQGNEYYPRRITLEE